MAADPVSLRTRPVFVSMTNSRSVTRAAEQSFFGAAQNCSDALGGFGPILKTCLVVSADQLTHFVGGIEDFVDNHRISYQRLANHHAPNHAASSIEFDFGNLTVDIAQVECATDESLRTGQRCFGAHVEPWANLFRHR